MSTEERLTTVEQNIDRLISLNENVVALIARADARIEQNRLRIEQNERHIQQIEIHLQQNERHIQQTQRLWIAFAKHYGLLDDIDFDTTNLDPDTN